MVAGRSMIAAAHPGGWLGTRQGTLAIPLIERNATPYNPACRGEHDVWGPAEASPHTCLRTISVRTYWIFATVLVSNTAPARSRTK